MTDNKTATDDPGIPAEPCFICEQPTGRTGNDSLYVEPGAGPFCAACYDLHACSWCGATGLVFVKRNGKGEIDYMSGTATSEETNCDRCKGKGYYD